ncbi:MAG: hypothetical protein K9K76_07895 [Halanaerobiales bacterium]|nr:hypothetical protein [Halanaerobiales bacterium]
MNNNLPPAYRADISSLRSVHIVNDGLKKVLNEIRSHEFECQIHYDFIENCGSHWNGYRCFLMDTKKRSLYYLHIGMIFHPDTKKGIMVELDKESNLNYYQKVKGRIQKGKNYSINKEEKDYLKLFLKDDILEKMNSSNVINEQLKVLQNFLEEALLAIIKGGR